jgi:glycosyltransferase involved in cell wall biosynthesis
VPRLSIIIPTHKRAAILQQTLEHIEKQTIKDDLEVIVVGDGEDSETAKLFEREWSIPVTYFAIPKSHQGVARNRGVEKAKGEYILFIGDDAFLAPDACEKHIQALTTACHTEPAEVRHADAMVRQAHHDTLVLGHTTWDPSLTITPVMKWLEESGWQFGYPKIAEYKHDFIPSSIQHSYTYTIHISLPTAIAKQFPFREDVTLYGWEDMEWGMRLKHAGVKLFYEPDAKAYHHHPMTLEQSLKRMETIGSSAVAIEKISPELHVLPRGWKRFAYHLLSFLPTMQGKHARAYVKGIEEGLQSA